MSWYSYVEDDEEEGSEEKHIEYRVFHDPIVSKFVTPHQELNALIWQVPKVFFGLSAYQPPT